MVYEFSEFCDLKFCVWIWVLGFGVSDFVSFGFRIVEFRFFIWFCGDFGFRVSVSGFGFWFRVWGFGFRV